MLPQKVLLTSRMATNGQKKLNDNLASSTMVKSKLLDTNGNLTFNWNILL